MCSLICDTASSFSWISKLQWDAGSEETRLIQVGCEDMDAKLDDLLTLTERVLLHAEHDIPQEQEVLQRLHELIVEIRGERNPAFATRLPSCGKEQP
jgi:hypothetical protein